MKKLPISLVMITKNSAETLERSLNSIKDLVSEIIIVDSHSKDRTQDVARKFTANVYFHNYRGEGEQRKIAIAKARQEWILILDSDEVVSPALRQEIRQKLSVAQRQSGFTIPFQNHFLGREIRHGGENYKKIRLFRRNSKDIHLNDLLVHAELKGDKKTIGLMRNKILHYSYRSLAQMCKKFSDYAWREAKGKRRQGERTSIKKIVSYPLHMFWARFVEDKGYQDGFFRIPLDLGFAYMEFLTYFLMLFIKKNK